MGTVIRQVVVNPPYAARRLLFDFAQQNPLMNVLFVSPGSPYIPSDLSPQRAKPAWNPALYDVQPNYALLTPVVTNTPPPFTPALGDLQKARPAWNPALYELQQPMGLLQQAASFPPFQALRDPLPPRVSMKGLLPVLEQNLLNTLLSGAGGGPFIPVDIGGPPEGAKRNSSLYFDSANIVISLSTGAMPVQSLDWNVRAAVRRPTTFDAPNLALSLNTGAMPAPTPDLSPPIRQARRSPSIYDAQGTLLPTLMFAPAVLPPAAYPDVGYRYTVRRNPPSAEWIEPQRALLSAPIFTATIPNLSYRLLSGVQTYNAGLAFSGATSYSIAPALDSGITFNTSTGVVTTNTAVAILGAHGPYTITGTNVNGSIASNAFTITINSGDYQVDGPRVTDSTTSLGATYTVSGPHCSRDTPLAKDLS